MAGLKIKTGKSPLCFCKDLSLRFFVNVYVLAHGLHSSAYLDSISYSLRFNKFLTISSGSSGYWYIFSSMKPL